MARRATARDQLRRILYLLPVAARERGVLLTELADALGVPEERVIRDLDEVMSRVFYHSTGGADDIQVAVEGDRVRAFTTGQFRRPPKLSAREVLALGVGLRTRAAAAVAGDVDDGPAGHARGGVAAGVGRDRTHAGPGERERLLDLARSLEARLASVAVEELLPRYAVRDDPAGGEGLRTLLTDAARARRRCRITYLKPEDEEPTERRIEPYVLAYGSGRWYVVGRDRDRDREIRVFRLDRILEAVVLEETFTRPGDFRAGDYVADGRVYRAEDEDAVVIRYSPAIARWILERGRGAEQPDGSAVVERRAADPGWAVRHVLQYADAAEVLEPRGMREAVREAAIRVAEAHAPRA